MDEKLKTEIIKKIKDEGCFELLEYERLYSDTLTPVKGRFRIEVKEFVYTDSGEFAKGTFDIIATEGTHEMDIFDFYKHFTTEQALYNHINQLLDRFDTIESLQNHVFHKSKFIKSDNGICKDCRVFAYELMKDDLEDGTTLEDFLYRLE